jgi:hypothetical protein
MRKLLTLAATLSLLTLLGLSSITASADSSCAPNPNGTTTCTVNLHNQTLALGSAPACGLDGVGQVTNANEIFHFTVDRAGDSWVTGTLEGDLTFTLSSTETTYTGHFAAWFGSEDNNRNTVNNGTINVQARAADGSTIGLHVSAGFGVSASGQPIMHMNVVCN